MSSPILKPGQTIGGDFVIERSLGAGGMGAVFLALQQSTGVRRALKVMHPGIAQSPGLRERFVREARIGAGIPSDHVVHVIAAGIDDDGMLPFLVMELLQGEDLAAVIQKRGRVDARQLLAMFRQLCHALGAAHALGIVHRDLKPQNIFLSHPRTTDRPWMLKVLDFGIAKVVEESKVHSTEAIGTPLWMAPEQTARGSVIAPQTDVWALGLLAFFCLTGNLYWRSAADDDASLHKFLREVLIDPLVPAHVRGKELGVGLPDWFQSWFDRCVVRESSARFANATEALAALSTCIESAPAPLTPPEALQATAPMERPPSGALYSRCDAPVMNAAGSVQRDLKSSRQSQPDADPAALPRSTAAIRILRAGGWAGVLGLLPFAIWAYSKAHAPQGNMPTTAVPQARADGSAVQPSPSLPVPEWVRSGGRVQSQTKTPAGNLSIIEFEPRSSRYAVELAGVPIVITECCDAYKEWVGNARQRYHGALDLQPRLVRTLGAVTPFDQVYLMQQFPDGLACEAGLLWFLGTNADGSYGISDQIDFCLGPEPVIAKQDDHVAITLPGTPDLEQTENWVYRDGNVHKLPSTDALPAYAALPRPSGPSNPLSLVGKHPWELFDDADLDPRLRTILKAEYRPFKTRLEVAGNSNRAGDYVVGHGCMRHGCGTDMAYFAVSISTHALYCAVLSDGEIRTFSSNDAVPPEVQEGIKKVLRGT